jgi:hypothetical protein
MGVVRITAGLAAAALIFCVLSGPATAQTWGQGHGPWGGGPTEWDGRVYAATGHAATGHGHGARQSQGGYGDPRAYRAPGGHGYGHAYGHDGRGHDRGGRYGYSTGNRWTRWSSPPGRGYHDAYGYNDDRAPRGPDRGRRYSSDCQCAGAYLYDR